MKCAGIRLAWFGLISGLLLISLGCTGFGWKGKLDRDLAVYGHRNWIVVADSAYPKQSAEGIQTIATGATQLDLLADVLAKVEKAPHVRAKVILDAELDHVSDADAPGVAAYREALQKMLGARDVRKLPHEEIIARLDSASKVFNVLILKSDMTLPYTSVFLELDCGYWGPDEEARLRASMAP